MHGDAPDASPGAPQEDIESLVRQAQEGSVAAFGQLYERFYDAVFRYVLVKVGHKEDAEDITEEVFLRLVRSVHTYRLGKAPFGSWLFRVAHNLVVDHHRRRRKDRGFFSLEAAEHSLAAPDGDVDGALDVEMAMKRVREAMGELTHLQREVLALRFAAGLSLRETAQAMGKKENAVKVLQHAALRKLRRLLAGEVTALAEGASSTPETEAGR